MQIGAHTPTSNGRLKIFTNLANQISASSPETVGYKIYQINSGHSDSYITASNNGYTAILSDVITNCAQQADYCASMQHSNYP